MSRNGRIINRILGNRIRHLCPVIMNCDLGIWANSLSQTNCPDIAFLIFQSSAAISIGSIVFSFDWAINLRPSCISTEIIRKHVFRIDYRSKCADISTMFRININDIAGTIFYDFPWRITLSLTCPAKWIIVGIAQCRSNIPLIIDMNLILHIPCQSISSILCIFYRTVVIQQFHNRLVISNRT